jgi:CBS domain-containing protein
MTQVSQVMQQNVRVISSEASIPEVLQIFAEENISGAPVVDSSGRVVGVVSASDLIRVVAREAEIASGDVALGSSDVPAEEYDDEDIGAFFMALEPGFSVPGNRIDEIAGGPYEGYTVRDIMTAATFSVSPEDSVEEVAGFLLRGRIHRALVMSEGRLRGLVSSFDLLRVLAGEIQEGSA